MEFEGVGGVAIAASVFGPEDGAPVLMVGGLGQTRHSWHRAAERIASGGRRAITVDLRGHGDSGWSADGDYGYHRTAGDMACVARALGRPVTYVGASLGGKIGLVAAAEHGSDVFAGLVIVDSVPPTNPAGVAEVTQVLRPPPEGFVSLDAAAAELARLRGAPTPPPGSGERLRRNMRQDSRGYWHWHWDPAWMDREQGIGMAAATEFLDACAEKLTMPTLLTRGEKSNVVTEPGLAEFRARVPQLEVETIAGASHMIVGDANDAFAAAVTAFLDRTPGL